MYLSSPRPSPPLHTPTGSMTVSSPVPYGLRRKPRQILHRVECQESKYSIAKLFLCLLLFTMAEIALIRISLKLVWGLIANRAIARLETGNPSDEKLRQLLLSEFRKLHEELDALRRKELVAATAFMENAYEIFNEDAEEAKKEFNKARDAAQVALGVVKELQDKVLATKIMIASAIHEFEDKPEVAAALCMKYVARLNSLPPVVSASSIQAGQKIGPKWRWGSGSATRHDILGTVSEINRCVRYFVVDQVGNDKYLEGNRPHIVVEGRLFNPLTDFILLRKCVELSTFPEDFGVPICMVAFERKIFFAQSQLASQEDDPFIRNAIKCLDLDTGVVSDLVGHAGNVLCMAKVGSVMASGSFDRKILIWDTKSGKCEQILSGHEGSVGLLAVNELHIFSGSTDCTIRVWDRETYELQHTLEGHSAPISALTVSNRHLFSCEVNGPIKYWDLKKWTCLHDVESPGIVDRMHIISSSLFVSFDKKLSIVSLGNLKEVSVIKQPAKMSVMIGKTLCTASESTLQTIDISNMKIITSKVFKIDDMPYCVKCLYYDEVTGYLFITCSFLTGKGAEKLVLFRL